MIEILRYTTGSSKAVARTLDDLAADAKADDGVVWVDCAAPTAEELTALFDVLQVNEFAREDLTKGGQRTKLAHYESHSYVSVYDCALHDDGLRTREIDIVLGTSWFLSVRQAPDDAEEAVLADERSDGTKKPRPMQLYSLGKSLVRFRRAAIPLRDVVAEIVRREVPYIDDGALIHFQDLADHVLRVSDFIESQRDVLTSLRDAELSLASNRMSLVQQKIAAWGAIFLVATLVTGVLGMNFRDAPNLSWGTGFLAVGGITLVLCVPMYRYFKRKSWV